MPEEIEMGPAEVKVSPEAFHLYATHFYTCKQDFKSPDDWSPVPYFLLCRAIELEIKSKHLKGKSQKEVKDEYGHRLSQAYNALDQNEQVLTETEKAALAAASLIYNSKGFEYFNPYYAATGFSEYPDLRALDSIAKKLIDNA